MTGRLGESSLIVGGGSLPVTVGRGDSLVLWPTTAQEREVFVETVADDVVELGSPLLARVDQAPFRIQRAYPTIESWVAGSNGNLAGEKRREIGLLYDGVFSENVVISGASVDETHYRVLTVAEGHRHRGVAGTGVVISPTQAGHGVAISEDFVRLAWLEVTDWSTDSAGSFDGVSIVAENVLLEYLLVHDDGHGNVYNSDSGGIQLERSFGSATIRNSIVYGVARSGIAIHDSNDATLVIDNCSLYRCDQDDNAPQRYGCVALSGQDNVIQARNVISMNSGSGSDFNIAPDSNSTYRGSEHNLSSDSSAPGESSLIEVEQSTIFVSTTVGAEDLHLREGAAAIDAAIDLSEFFSIDIDAQQRSAIWDVGADER